MNRFAIFILSHGRANTITTFKAFRDGGYTGDMYVVIDDEDEQEEVYRQKFGDSIIQFCKKDYVPKTDLGDLDDDRRIGVLARNFIQDKAKEMGYDCHLQLDDDIHGLAIRHEDANGNLKTIKVRNIDKLMDNIVEFFMNTPLTSLSFGLPPYYAGGVESLNWKKKMIPKTMTTFFMKKDDICFFNMRMNDDITTSALNNMRGKLYYSFLPIMVMIDGTQEQSGGMTEIYTDNGTYRKSFYTVMAMPSCTKIIGMGVTHNRWHHEITWENCVPKILSPKYKK